MKLTRGIVQLASKPDKIRLIDDIWSAFQINVEADLHDMVGDMLTVRGIKFVHSRMDKRTTQEKGVPDFLFAVWFESKTGDKTSGLLQGWPIAVAFECKMPGEQLTPEQVEWFRVASEYPNAFCCKVVHNFFEVLAELKKLNL